MASSCLVWVVVTSCLFSVCRSSPGDKDLLYRACLENCERTGCIEGACFRSCKLTVNVNGAEVLQNKCPYDKWVEWDCPNECKYQCMIRREEQRKENGEIPVKYHGKWPLKRLIGLQEPFSVLFSIGNFLAHGQGLISFLYLVQIKLPKRPQGKKGPYYEYCGLWTLYGLASLNSWFWSAAFHARDTEFTERVDYSSAVALLGLSFIVAIIRSFNLRIEAARVMVAAPVIAFVATHILFLNLYEFDYGWNMKVCVTIGVLQLLLWMFWAAYVRHPSRLKVWFVVLAGSGAMLLEIFDFPPLMGFFDAHSLWHAVTIPLTMLWWSFVKDDASFRTSQLLNRRKQDSGESKKLK